MELSLPTTQVSRFAAGHQTLDLSFCISLPLSLSIVLTLSSFLADCAKETISDALVIHSAPFANYVNPYVSVEISKQSKANQPPTHPPSTSSTTTPAMLGGVPTSAKRQFRESPGQRLSSHGLEESGSKRVWLCRSWRLRRRPNIQRKAATPLAAFGRSCSTGSVAESQQTAAEPDVQSGSPKEKTY